MMNPALLSLPLALLILLPAPARQDDAASARLAEARRLLDQPPEGDARSGADICAKENSPEAVEVLLEVLRRDDARPGYLAPAHYRDVVWGSLGQITDLYAQKVVEAELKRNSKDAWVRQWCAELLGIYGDHDFGQGLLKALSDKSDGVRAAAARSLGKLRYEPALKGLQKTARSKDPFVRANSLEAMALIEPVASEKAFLKGLGDKDGGVRCALTGALPAAYPEQTEPLSILRLADDDWRPRIQAVENLGKVRTKTAVDALISALADGRPVVGRRANDELQELTGQGFTREDQWTRWWEANRATFSFPEGRGARTGGDADRTVATFNGIQLVSDHVAFLMDKSRAMSEPLKSRGKSKDEAAHEELAGVFEKLDGRLTFNLFNYALDIEAFEKRPVELGKSTAKRGLAFHEKGSIYGAKDIWKALSTAFEDPTLDTVYLLSSGEPDVGLYVHWNRVTWQLKELNRFHKIVVHSVAYSDNQWYRDQLEKISEATGGEFQWFE
jgi:HEAT repeat protein